MASSPSPYQLHPRELPSAPRQQVHLEEGMPGGHGEVRRKEVEEEAGDECLAVIKSGGGGVGRTGVSLS